MTSTADKYERAGGPAHPVPDMCEHGGMTLRDYFAGQALVAVIRQCGGDEREKGEDMTQMFARKSYALADAMLAERGVGS